MPGISTLIYAARWLILLQRAWKAIKRFHTYSTDDMAAETRAPALRPAALRSNRDLRSLSIFSLVICTLLGWTPTGTCWAANNEGERGPEEGGLLVSLLFVSQSNRLNDPRIRTAFRHRQLLTVGLVPHNTLDLDDELLSVNCSDLALATLVLAAHHYNLIVLADGDGAHLQRIATNTLHRR
jgi:hypothetical protein